MDECLITRIAKADMIATLHNDTDFSELFMAYLLARNSRIEEDLVDQLFNSSERRLARLLLANFGEEGRPEPIVGKSKYPPAKPGALRSEPLKAAARGRSRAPVAVDRSSTSPPIFSLPQ